MNPLDIARRTLKRVHATNERNIPNILMSRLEPRPHHLDPEGRPSVFMSAGSRLDNTFYKDEYGNRNALIRYRIPKDWHRENVVLNPHYQELNVVKDPDWSRSYEANEMDRKVADVSRGGRAVTYSEAVPNDFIEEICFGPNAEWCYDPKVLMQHVSNDTFDDGMWEWDAGFYPRAWDVFNKYGRK